MGRRELMRGLLRITSATSAPPSRNCGTHNLRKPPQPPQNSGNQPIFIRSRQEPVCSRPDRENRQKTAKGARIATRAGARARTRWRLTPPPKGGWGLNQRSRSRRRGFSEVPQTGIEMPRAIVVRTGRGIASTRPKSGWGVGDRVGAKTKAGGNCSEGVDGYE